MQVVHNTEQTGACGAVGSALPWHGRGREFESHQVHQNKAQQNIDLRKCLRACTSRKRGSTPTTGHAESIWSPNSPEFGLQPAAPALCRPPNRYKTDLDPLI